MLLLRQDWISVLQQDAEGVTEELKACDQLAWVGAMNSIRSRQLVELFGANIVASAAPLAEGDAADRKDIIFLEKLPLFFK